MIEAADIGHICDYLGVIWCILNLVWGLFRNDAYRCLVYGIGVFAACVVMLNVGGLLNEESWGLFGIGVFGLHLVYTFAVNFSSYRCAVYGILFTASVLSYAGAFRCSN